MANYNKVFLMGNLTRDIELRYTQNGKAVGNSAIAVNRKSGDKEETTFVNIVVWEKSAEILAEHTKKGSPLFIEGRLQVRSWEKDGEKKLSTEVVVETFQFIGKKGE